MERITGNLHVDVSILMTISSLLLLIMRNISDNICSDYQDTHFIFSTRFTVYKIMWKIVVKSDRPQTTI
jgi:hypothetical protein